MLAGCTCGILLLGSFYLGDKTSSAYYNALMINSTNNGKAQITLYKKKIRTDHKLYYANNFDHVKIVKDETGARLYFYRRKKLIKTQKIVLPN